MIHFQSFIDYQQVKHVVDLFGEFCDSIQIIYICPGNTILHISMAYCSVLTMKLRLFCIKQSRCKWHGNTQKNVVLDSPSKIPNTYQLVSISDLAFLRGLAIILTIYGYTHGGNDDIYKHFVINHIIAMQTCTGSWQLGSLILSWFNFYCITDK